MACYAEEVNNQVKIDALAQVKQLAKEGNKVYRVESKSDSTLVGFQVGHEDEVVFSHFRKQV